MDIIQMTEQLTMGMIGQYIPQTNAILPFSEKNSMNISIEALSANHKRDKTMNWGFVKDKLDDAVGKMC